MIKFKHNERSHKVKNVNYWKLKKEIKLLKILHKDFYFSLPHNKQYTRIQNILKPILTLIGIQQQAAVQEARVYLQFETSIIAHYKM